MTHSIDLFAPATHCISVAAEGEAVRVNSAEEPLAYLELTPRQTFAVAYALVGHCRRFGGRPTTGLQDEIAGLRDFLLDLLDDQQVDILLRSA